MTQQLSSKQGAVAILFRSSGKVLSLAHCLRSVCSQSDTEWRLFIVLDSALDKEGQSVVDAFSDPRIVVVVKQQRVSADLSNVEQSTAKLLSDADHTLVAFYNEGDIWSPTFLSRARNSLNQDPTLVAVGALFEDSEPDGVRMTAMTRLGLEPVLMALVIRSYTVRKIGHYSDLLSRYGQLDYQKRVLTLGDVHVLGGPALVTK